MQNIKRNFLSQLTKDLMQNVTDNSLELLPLMHQLSRYNDRNMILKWLIRNRITGVNLIEWLKIYHQNSIMNMVKFIVKSHNRDKEFKPIILNKDWA